MGLAQKRKGRAQEYLLRDLLRKQGWEAERVPGSGAYTKVQGDYKGDIKASKNGREVLFELKSRKDEFKLVYPLIAALRHFDATGMVETETGKMILFGNTPEDTHEGRAIFTDLVVAKFPNFKRTINKVFRMQRLLKGADYLVVKNDRMPHIFMRYT